MNSLIGLGLIAIGGFVGFSSTSTLMDDYKKRVKFSNNIFGIIRTGKWIDINPEMKLGLKRSNISYRTYSRSNQSLNVSQKDVRVFLYNSNGEQIMPIKKYESLKEAQVDLIELSAKVVIGSN